MNNNIIVRFAPSPTGPLHIGGARTALFNWLFAKNQGGLSLLRIEDTDKARSKKEFEDQIIETLKWLEINPDKDPVKQSLNINKHVEVANNLLSKGFAYKCYCSHEELEKEKELSKKNNLPYVYSGKCRESNKTSSSFIVRFKSKKSGTTILNDLVQGKIEISNSTIEDFVILRSDNTPTYQLSASVDDHLMKISHVIRGDDHKINTFKQIQIFEAMNWKIPSYAHIPLIHSMEGKKLSKRDSATTVEDYKKIGILPESLRNYLLRLGWSYKDKEIFTLKESIELFNLEGIGKSPSKLDMDRVLSINETYIKNLNENTLFNYFELYVTNYKEKINDISLNKIKTNFSIFKNKAKTLEDIFNNTQFIFNYKKINFEKEINDSQKKLLNLFLEKIRPLQDHEFDRIKTIIEDILNEKKIKFKDFGQPVRIVLTGTKFAPSINEIIVSLGIEETKKRLSLYL
jgi:glutamyl-tRNA synthetase